MGLVLQFSWLVYFHCISSLGFDISGALGNHTLHRVISVDPTIWAPVSLLESCRIYRQRVVRRQGMRQLQ